MSSKLLNTVLKLSAIGVFTILVFAPALKNGFLDMDDSLYIRDNPYIQNGLTLDSLKWSLTADFFKKTDHCEYWQPITMISRALDISFHGKDPMGHHLTNLLLHLINICLVYFLFVLIFNEPIGATIACLIFAVHPLQVEPVSWVTARKDLMSEVFLLLTFIFYIFAGKKEDRRFYFASIAAYAFALMSKPVHVTVPILLILLNWSLLQKTFFKKSFRLRTAVLEGMPHFFLAAFCALAVRFSYDTIEHELPISNLVTFALNGTVSYLKRFVYPVGLNFVGVPDAQTFSTTETVVSVMVLTTLIFIAIKRGWKDPITWGLGWFFIALLPALKGSALNDRFMYLPIVGLCMVCGSYSGRLLVDHSFRWVVAVLFLTVLVTLSVITRNQIFLWKDDFTLLNDALKHSERNWVAHSNLSFSYININNLEKAEYHAVKAANYAPDRDDIQGQLARVYSLEKKYDKALEVLKHLFELNPTYKNGLYQLMFIYRETGREDDLKQLYKNLVDNHVIEQLETLLSSNPNRLEDNIILANLYQYVGDKSKLEPCLRRILVLNPSDNYCRFNLGVLLQNSWRNDEAIDLFKECLQRDPKMKDVYNSLGISLARANKINESIASFEQGLRLDPKNAEMYYNLGVAYAKRGDVAKARASMTAALKIKPNYLPPAKALERMNQIESGK